MVHEGEGEEEGVWCEPQRVRSGVGSVATAQCSRHQLVSHTVMVVMVSVAAAPPLSPSRCVGASASGQIFTFGHGGYGQLGHGDKKDVSTPQLVEALKGEQVVGASAGSNHTAVWTGG